MRNALGFAVVGSRGFWVKAWIAKILFLTLILIGLPARAETLREAVESGVLNNPEVLAKWHLFNAADDEKRAAKGGYYPRVDVDAAAGYESYSSPNGRPVDDYNHNGGTLQLRQMLFDGFAISNEVKRLDKHRIASYYDFLNASNQLSLEATRAYIDVLRYRELDKLARENYASHKEISDLVRQRSESGVGRRVDMEQAAGRLALSEANWLTESGNKLDVSARFRRITGHVPGEALDEVPDLPSAAVGSGTALMQRALQKNPEYISSIANTEAAKAEASGRKASRWPTLDLRVFERLDDTLDGVDGRTDNKGVQLLLNYNIYRGGSDHARERVSANRYDAARELHAKACRDLHQNVSIDWADMLRLREKQTYLEQHEQSVARAMNAYRMQFDAGQRSLLDLLDTHNELFEARRASVNGRRDLQLANARVLAVMNELMPALLLAPKGDAAPDFAWSESDYGCPTNVADPQLLDKAGAMAEHKNTFQPVVILAPVAQPAPAADADTDGVIDSNDNCPSTPTGVVVDAKGCPVQKPKVLQLNTTGLFENGKSSIVDEKSLTELAENLKKQMDVVSMIIISGHSDQTGLKAKNMQLSLDRANSVRAFLLEKGIPAQRVRTIGSGSAEPLVELSSCVNAKTKKKLVGAALSECLKPNRRIVVEVFGSGLNGTK